MQRSPVTSGNSARGPIDEAEFEALSAASVALLAPLISLDSSVYSAPDRELCEALQQFVLVAEQSGLPAVARLAGLILARLSESAATRSDDPTGERLETLIVRIVEFCAGDPDRAAASNLLDALRIWANLSEASEQDAGLHARDLHADGQRILAWTSGDLRAERQLAAHPVSAEALQLLAQEARALVDGLAALRRAPKSLSSRIGSNARGAATGAAATDRLVALHQLAERFDALAEAAAAIGATVLCQILGRAQVALQDWLQPDFGVNTRALVLLEALASRFAGYLANPDRERAELLVALLAEPGWPTPMQREVSRQLVEDLCDLRQRGSRHLDAPAEQITADALSLQLPEDVERTVLAQLLGELPALAGPLAMHLQRASAGSASDLANAFRIAHTLKGAAQTVGVRGVATLTHRLEDVLEALTGRPAGLTAELQVGLQRAAVCLLAMADALNARGPAPTDALLVCETLGDLRTQLLAMPLEPDTREPRSGTALERHRMAPGSVARPAQESAGTPQGFAGVTSDLLPSMRAVHTIEPRLARVVGQAARIAGRQAALQISGQDLQLDSRLLEAFIDPLSHLLRNAVDHGIEAQGLRQSRGKPPVGRLHLSFERVDGELEIRCSDDGAGLDLDAIATRARQAGLLDSEVPMTDALAADLILSAGFSTRDVVTQISGRGIGLDVVRDAIEALNGQIRIESQTGVGTVFRIRIPTRG